MGAVLESQQFRLLILGDGSVRTVPLDGTRWTIGRGPDCTVPLRDPTVSRQHLLLERVGDRFHFQDLGSANLVQVEGRPVRQGSIGPGDSIRIGLTRLLIERRHRPTQVTTAAPATVVLSREVVDSDVPVPLGSFSSTAARVLQRIEWTFADLGDIADTAEPLLELALSLTGRQSGWIARFDGRGGAETLAYFGAGRDEPPALAENVMLEAQRIGQPHLVTTSEDGVPRERLLIPLGKDVAALVVLELPDENAPSGQEVLRLAQSLGSVVWHRMQETLERLRLRQELERLRFHGTVGHNALLTSQRLQPARERLRALAASAETVLLIGEPGTELEELARYLHAEGPRRAHPFVAWDAATAAPDRQAAELFGSLERNGLLQRAAGGTLFIDNAHALQLEIQGSLTAAGPAQRLVLGTANSPVDDPRIWSPELRSGLASTGVTIPPLRSEPRDVLPLAELFLAALGSGPDGSPRLLSERTKRLLTSYAWPGNTRELRLAIEAAAGQAGSQPIAPRHLPPALASDTEGSAAMPTLEDVERDHIRSVMQVTAGVRSRAAQILGIATSTLYEKLKRYNIG